MILQRLTLNVCRPGELTLCHLHGFHRCLVCCGPQCIPKRACMVVLICISVANIEKKIKRFLFNSIMYITDICFRWSPFHRTVYRPIAANHLWDHNYTWDPYDFKANRRYKVHDIYDKWLSIAVRRKIIYNLYPLYVCIILCIILTFITQPKWYHEHGLIHFINEWWIPTQSPVTRSFDVFHDRCLNKQLSKQ